MEFPAKYNQLNWVIKISILDPIKLRVWEFSNAPRLVPSEEDARAIGLTNDWRKYLDKESIELLGV